jgi:hypothetical protein
VLVAERRQLRPQPLEHRRELRQSGPVLHVRDRRRPEGAQVPQHDVADRRRGLELAPGPRLDRRVPRVPAGAPHPARRDLDERHGNGCRVPDGLDVVADAPLDEPPAELAPGQRAVGDELLPDGGRELRGVSAAHPPPVRAAVVALDDDLQQRTQSEGVADGHEVDRRAHQGEAHDRTLGEHPAQLVRVEALQPRPQAVVGRHRRLRLEPEEVLDHRRDRDVRAAQQSLALEQRPVERTGTENLIAHRQHIIVSGADETARARAGEMADLRWRRECRDGRGVAGSRAGPWLLPGNSGIAPAGRQPLRGDRRRDVRSTPSRTTCSWSSSSRSGTVATSTTHDPSGRGAPGR